MHGPIGPLAAFSYSRTEICNTRRIALNPPKPHIERCYDRNAAKKQGSPPHQALTTKVYRAVFVPKSNIIPEDSFFHSLRHCSPPASFHLRCVSSIIIHDHFLTQRSLGPQKSLYRSIARCVNPICQRLFSFIWVKRNTLRQIGRILRHKFYGFCHAGALNFGTNNKNIPNTQTLRLIDIRAEEQELHQMISEAISRLTQLGEERLRILTGAKSGIPTLAFDRDGRTIRWEMGLTQEAARSVMAENFFEPSGFPEFRLRNNNADIKRMKERLADLESQEAASGHESVTISFSGGEVVMDFQENRVKLPFPAKSDSETIIALKKSGFRWSPTNSCWQRQLTANALNAVTYMTNVDPQALFIKYREVRKGRRESRRGNVRILPAAFWRYGFLASALSFFGTTIIYQFVTSPNWPEWAVERSPRSKS